MTPESTGQQDVRSYLRILWRWRLPFLACLVLIPAAVYLIEQGKPKVYQSNTLVQLTGQGTAGASGAVAPTNLLAVAQLVTTTPVATAAAAILHPPGRVQTLLHEVTASADTSTGFLTITAHDRSPQRAAAIANAFAAALNGHQTTQAKQGLDVQISAYLTQLAATSNRAQATRAALVQQIAQLRAESDASGSSLQVIERAVAAATPVGPETTRAVEIAIVIALLLGVGVVVLAENGDRRLRAPESLERLTNVPLLGVIPASAFSPGQRGRVRDEGAFQMLSASLMFFNVDRPLSSVAIISPGPWEGKTTVAAGLAVAAGRSGRRVILVDADLRRPMVCERLGITATAGLGAVLTRQLPLAAALLEHPVDPPPGASLRVLPAGPPPPNPSALLASLEMRTLLQELTRQSDLVILDTPAALAVTDALPLFQAVSGVVMIARMNRSSQDAVQRMQSMITSAGGTVLGVVATGSVSAAGYGSGYEYYAKGHRAARRSLLRRGRRAPTHKRSAASPSAAAAPAGAQPAPDNGTPAEPRRAPLVSELSALNGATAPTPADTHPAHARRRYFRWSRD